MTHFEWFIVATVILFFGWRVVSFVIGVLLELERQKRNRELKARWDDVWGKFGEEQAKLKAERESDKK